MVNASVAADALVGHAVGRIAVFFCALPSLTLEFYLKIGSIPLFVFGGFTTFRQIFTEVDLI